MRASGSSHWKIWAGNVFSGLLILVIAYGLKKHSSAASPEELGWILKPTANLVGLFSGTEFFQEFGMGYVRADLKYVIATACSGMNFLIIAFCMSGFYGLFNFNRWSSKLLYICGCLAGSYVLTLLVNAVRIDLSILMFSENVQWGWLDPQRIHRLTGIGLYLFALLALYSLLEQVVVRSRRMSPEDRSVRRTNRHRFSRHAVPPYFWYVAITVGVPFLNRGWQNNGSLFMEHCLTITTVSMTVFLSGFLIKSARVKLIKLQGGNERKKQNTHCRG